MAHIALQDVSFGYEPGKLILQELNLEIADGERHAILGASGAGKTTLLNILSGLLTPTAGQVCFDAQDVTQTSAADRSLTQVFQFPVLYEALSVQANLEFALRNHGEYDDEAGRRIQQVVDELDIADCLTEKPKRLSLYQKQLVAVAKAIVRTNTSLVLLDEPLTAVDPKRKWQMRQVLCRIQEKFGLTMIYVTHDQTEAMAFADRVSLLTTQGIAQTATPQELFDRPATPFVGYFVGSPGMNFVPGSSIGSAYDQVGFRPDWAVLSQPAVQPTGPDTPTLQGVVVTYRALPDGGIAFVETDHGEMAVRAKAAGAGDTVDISLPRYACFDADKLVDVVGIRQ